MKATQKTLRCGDYGSHSNNGGGLKVVIGADKKSGKHLAGVFKQRDGLVKKR